MAIELVPLTRIRQIVSNAGLLTQEASFYFQQLELLQPITGQGTPENNVEGQAGQTYYNLSGSSGAIIYIKTVDDVAGDAKKGWVLA